MFRTFFFAFLVNFVISTRIWHKEELFGPLPSWEAPNDEFGRATRRGKVDVLGLTLKKRRVNHVHLICAGKFKFQTFLHFEKRV